MPVGTAQQRVEDPPTQSGDSDNTRAARRLGAGAVQRSRAIVNGAVGLVEQAGKVGQRLGRDVSPYLAAARPWLGRVRKPLEAVSGLGWVVVAAAVVAGLVGARLGWREASYVAGVLGVLFVGACLFAIGRTKLRIRFELAPQRVVVGESAAAQVTVTNTANSPLLPLGIEFPVGAQAARFTLPLLGPGASADDVVVIPTTKRGVVTLGPVTSQRGDPFGVIRREVAWTDSCELFVHPITVPLESLGAGLLRDLEGRTTQDMSMSDLAFHTLREYAPGDDRRYIHWRTSAKLAGASGSDRFLVRQFLDTRRSHVAIVTDVSEGAYASADEFELAVSVGASIAVRALADEMDRTIVCGDHVAVQPPPHQTLDTFSRAEMGGLSIAQATGRLSQLSPDASVVVWVTGRNCGFNDLLAARTYLPPEVACAAIRVDIGRDVALQATAGITVLTIGRLRDLARAMAGGQLA